MFPERANISLAHVTARDAITVKTWERGVGITRACGTAACAAAVAAMRKGLTDHAVTVTLPGGPLRIEWREDGHVMMTGPVETEFDGPRRSRDAPLVGDGEGRGVMPLDRSRRAHFHPCRHGRARPGHPASVLRSPRHEKRRGWPGRARP